MSSERSLSLRDVVKLGNRVLRKSFEDVADSEDRDSYLVEAVIFGDATSDKNDSRCIVTGQDCESEKVTVPANVNDGSDFMARWDVGGGKEAIPSTTPTETHRFATHVRLMNRIDEGVIGINVQQADWKKIEGKEFEKAPECKTIDDEVPKAHESSTISSRDIPSEETAIDNARDNLPGWNDVHRSLELQIPTIHLKALESDEDAKTVTLKFNSNVPRKVYMQSGGLDKYGRKYVKELYGKVSYEGVGLVFGVERDGSTLTATTEASEATEASEGKEAGSDMETEGGAVAETETEATKTTDKNATPAKFLDNTLPLLKQAEQLISNLRVEDLQITFRLDATESHDTSYSRTRGKTVSGFTECVADFEGLLRALRKYVPEVEEKRKEVADREALREERRKKCAARAALSDLTFFDLGDGDDELGLADTEKKESDEGPTGTVAPPPPVPFFQVSARQAPWCHKAVGEFKLDVSEDTGFFDAGVLEEEWKTYVLKRRQYEEDLKWERRQASKRSKYYDDDYSDEDVIDSDDYSDDPDNDYYDDIYERDGVVMRPSTRWAFLKKIRKHFRDALNLSFGEGIMDDFIRRKIDHASRGVFLDTLRVDPDGETVTATVRIFSSVGWPRMLKLEYLHHKRDHLQRNFGFDHRAWVQGNVYEAICPAGKVGGLKERKTDAGVVKPPAAEEGKTDAAVGKVQEAEESNKAEPEEVLESDTAKPTGSSNEDAASSPVASDGAVASSTAEVTGATEVTDSSTEVTDSPKEAAQSAVANDTTVQPAVAHETKNAAPTLLATSSSPEKKPKKTSEKNPGKFALLTDSTGVAEGAVLFEMEQDTASGKVRSSLSSAEEAHSLARAVFGYPRKAWAFGEPTEDAKGPTPVCENFLTNNEVFKLFFGAVGVKTKTLSQISYEEEDPLDMVEGLFPRPKEWHERWHKKLGIDAESRRRKKQEKEERRKKREEEAKKEQKRREENERRELKIKEEAREKAIAKENLEKEQKLKEEAEAKVKEEAPAAELPAGAATGKATAMKTAMKTAASKAVARTPPAMKSGPAMKVAVPMKSAAPKKTPKKSAAVAMKAVAMKTAGKKAVAKKTAGGKAEKTGKMTGTGKKNAKTAGARKNASKSTIASGGESSDDDDDDDSSDISVPAGKRRKVAGKA